MEDDVPNDERTYTENDVDAAMCMWEYVLLDFRKGGPYLEYGVAHGKDVLRATVARHAQELERHWREAKANKYARDFADDFVPQYMRDHVTRILT